MKRANVACLGSRAAWCRVSDVAILGRLGTADSHDADAASPAGRRYRDNRVIDAEHDWVISAGCSFLVIFFRLRGRKLRCSDFAALNGAAK